MLTSTNELYGALRNLYNSCANKHFLSILYASHIMSHNTFTSSIAHKSKPLRGQHLCFMLSMFVVGVSASAYAHCADWAIIDGERGLLSQGQKQLSYADLRAAGATDIDPQLEQEARLAYKTPIAIHTPLKSTLVELDMNSISQMAHLAKAWVRISQPTPTAIRLESTQQTRAYRSIMYRIIFDCINARYVYANSLAYADIQAQGELLGRNKISEREAIMQMKDIAPDTIAARVFKYTCYIPKL